MTPEHIAEALKQTCEVCHAKPGQPCHNIITGEEVATAVHMGRREIRS